MTTSQVFANAILKMTKGAIVMESTKNPLSPEQYYNDYLLEIFNEVKEQLLTATKPENEKELDKVFANSYYKIFKETMKHINEDPYGEEYIVNKIVLPELKSCKELLKHQKIKTQEIKKENISEEISFEM
jgi:hypothetical protein